MEIPKTINNHFKKYNFDTRVDLSKTLLERNAGCVPCIINIEAKDALKLKQPATELRILVNSNYSFGKLHCVLRKKIGLKQTEAMYLFVNNILIPNTWLINDIYNKYKNKDGFLYIDLRLLETFG